MLSEVRMSQLENRLEKQHAALQALKVKTLESHKTARDTERFLLDLRNTCLELAYIVHTGIKDLMGRPYIQHVLQVAEKASTVYGVCATVLGKVIENGRELGITPRSLVEDYLIPPSLLTSAEVLARHDGEVYDAYAQRVVQNYAATKVAIETAVDNANIARYDAPGAHELDVCMHYLHEAMQFKIHPAYQKTQRFEYVQDLIDLASLERMHWTDEYARDDDQMIHLCLYFGHESGRERRITLRYVAHIHGDRSVTMHVSTFCNSKKYSEHCLYRHRKTTLAFPCVQHVYEYIEEVKQRLGASPHLILNRAQKALAHVTLPLLLQETFVIEELERKHS